MTISVNVGIPIGGDKPSVSLSMDPEDATAIMGELGSLLRGEFTPAEQLQAFHDLLTSNLAKP